MLTELDVKLRSSTSDDRYRRLPLHVAAWERHRAPNHGTACATELTVIAAQTGRPATVPRRSTPTQQLQMGTPAPGVQANLTVQSRCRRPASAVYWYGSMRSKTCCTNNRATV